MDLKMDVDYLLVSEVRGQRDSSDPYRIDESDLDGTKDLVRMEPVLLVPAIAEILVGDFVLGRDLAMHGFEDRIVVHEYLV